MTLLKSWMNSYVANGGNPRPAFDSKFNPTIDAARSQARMLLAVLLIRELPIKSFYARCFIVYFYCYYFIGRSLRKGWFQERPIISVLQDYPKKMLMNRPDLWIWSHMRKLPKMPITSDPEKEWKMQQTPAYHQYHRCTYRYRLRRPRYLPWDGTRSQPTMPYVIDIGSGVINGTWKRQPNTTPKFK